MDNVRVEQSSSSVDWSKEKAMLQWPCPKRDINGIILLNKGETKKIPRYLESQLAWDPQN